MGMAASQARFLGLTARKTNTEYEGQQVNQQRTALANQSADLYNRLLTLEVPSPPDITNYYKTSYTYQSLDGLSDYEIISGLGSTSCIVQKATKVSQYTSEDTYKEMSGIVNYKTDTSGSYWSINFNGSTQMERKLQLISSIDEDTGKETYAATKSYIRDIMNGIYDSVKKDDSGKPVDLTSTGSERGFIIADLDVDGNPIASTCRELTVADIYECRTEYEKAKATGGYTQDELDAIKNAWVNKLYFGNDETTKFDGDTALQRNRLYNFPDGSSTSTSVPKFVQSCYLKEFDGTGTQIGGVNAEGVLVAPSTTESSVDVFRFTGLNETFYSNSYTQYSQINFESCTWVQDTSGRPSQFSGLNMLTGKTESHDLTVSTVKDETAYQQAMNDYTYKKNLYDKEVADINAKTEAIQAQDRTLELRLKQLDTEQKALQNEMEAVAKVIKTNVEKTFKTFAE